jgi:dTDP-4-dehydrorhamnose reductase
MLKLSQNLKEIKVVSDQVGSPTFADDLAICCLDLIEIIENTDQFEGYGIYNFSNEGFISWFEFAQVIFKKTGKEVIVKPIPTEAYPTAAERPLNSRLSKEKITTLLKKAPRNWMAALNDYLEDIS